MYQIFHKHEWEIVSKTKTPPKTPGDIGEIRCSNLLMEKLLSGTVTIIWKCQECGKMKREEMIGEEEEKLKDNKYFASAENNILKRENGVLKEEIFALRNVILFFKESVDNPIATLSGVVKEIDQLMIDTRKAFRQQKALEELENDGS
jgi:hypothetical protein